MIDFLIKGGALFTVPMTLIFFINVVLITRNFVFLSNGKFKNKSSAKVGVDTVKYVGVFLITLGVLGQIVGLYEAFQAIESKQIGVSPWLMAAGIRASSVSTILGFVYFLLSYAAWFFMNIKLNREREYVS